MKIWQLSFGWYNQSLRIKKLLDLFYLSGSSRRGVRAGLPSEVQLSNFCPGPSSGPVSGPSSNRPTSPEELSNDPDDGPHDAANDPVGLWIGEDLPTQEPQAPLSAESEEGEPLSEERENQDECWWHQTIFQYY